MKRLWPLLVRFWHWSGRAVRGGTFWATFAALLGWGLLTTFLYVHFGSSVVYASGGLLLLSLYGVRTALVTLWKGAILLHEEDKTPPAS